MCLKSFLWNFGHLLIYKGRKLFFSGGFFCLKWPKEAVTRGIHWRNRSLVNNYYLVVGQLDTSDIFATYGECEEQWRYAPKNLEAHMVGGGGHVGGSHPTKMSDLFQICK